MCVLHTTKALLDESRGECKSSDPLYALGKLAFVYLDRVRVPGLKKKEACFTAKLGSAECVCLNPLPLCQNL